MPTSKQTTVYLAPQLYGELKMRAAMTDRGLSDLINDALRASFREDALDEAALGKRECKAGVPYSQVRRRLKRDASYKLFVKPSAERELRRFPKQDLQRIDRRIRLLANEPRPPQCEKLSGESDYCVRQGDYRIAYPENDDDKIVEIFTVGTAKRSTVSWKAKSLVLPRRNANKLILASRVQRYSVVEWGRPYHPWHAFECQREAPSIPLIEMSYMVRRFVSKCDIGQTGNELGKV